MPRRDPAGAARPRARAFLAQADAGIAYALDDPERAVRALQRSDAEGLTDLEWLDHCPALEPIRGRPEFHHVRERVAARASSARAAYAAGTAPTAG